MFILRLAGKHNEAARAQLPCLIGALGWGGDGEIVLEGKSECEGELLEVEAAPGRLAAGSTAAPSES